MGGLLDCAAQLRSWVDRLSGHRPRVLLADGDDDRAQEAARWLLDHTPVRPLLVRSEDDPTSGLPAVTVAALQEAPALQAALRHHPDGTRRPEDEYAAMSRDALPLCAAHVAAGASDACVAGAGRPTGEVIRAGIKVIGLDRGTATVSSSFLILLPDGRRLAYGDCAVLPTPDERQLADVAVATARTFHALTGEDPVVAMLSFSTKGSAQHREVDLVRSATEIARRTDPDLRIDGELQFDAAMVQSVARTKAGDSSVAGHANVLIFPNLAAGNIAYKITERLAGGVAVGPILQGLGAPLNDLSRGCSSDDISAMALVSAVQSVQRREARKASV